MRITLGASAALALATIFLLGACSKRDAEPVQATAATAEAGGAAAPGGAVSPPPSPQNDAVNTDANTTETTQTPASNSFTEDQARGHIENAGYSDVRGLTKTPDGLWIGKAKKDGKSVDVSLDFKGAVTAR